MLDAAGARPITVLKTVKDQLNLDLKTAKDLVDDAPSVLVRDVDAAFADHFVRVLETAGAQAHLDRT